MDGGGSIGDWRSRSSVRGAVRRSASTPSTVPVFVHTNNHVAHHPEETRAKPPLKTFGPRTSECNKDARTTLNPDTVAPIKDECAYTEKDLDPSCLRSIEKMLDVTINELTKQLDDVETEEPVNHDHGRPAIVHTKPTKVVADECVRSGKGPGTSEWNRIRSGATPASTSGVLQPGYGNYDVLPPPIPVFNHGAERRTSSSGNVSSRPVQCVETTDQSVVCEKTKHSADHSIGYDRSGSVVHVGSGAKICSIANEHTTNNGFHARSENASGQLVISWDDRRAANKTNKVDASVCIGAGTVASRVNIFDVQERPDKPWTSRPSSASCKIGAASHTKIPLSTAAVSHAIDTQPQGPVTNNLKRSSPQTIPQQPTFEGLQMRETPPSPSATFLPPPPASWTSQKDLSLCDGQERHSSGSSPPTAIRVSSSQTTDMLKFKVDRHMPQNGRKPKLETGDTNEGYVHRINVRSEPRPDHRSNDMSAIGLKLEKLITSIDQQNKHIKSMNAILEACHYKYARPVLERDEGDYYYKKDDFLSPRPRHMEGGASTRKLSGKDGRVKLFSCIR